MGVAVGSEFNKDSKFTTLGHFNQFFLLGNTPTLRALPCTK